MSSEQDAAIAADVTERDMTLIETKLHAPRRRSGVVERARLTTRTVGRDRPALTLVSAPAGFGKTTLLTDLFVAEAAKDQALAWLSLDAGDNDPRRFWSYVIAAIQSAAPEAGEAASALLRSDPAGLEPVVATLVNDLDILPMNLVVVLDDYHVIETPEIHDTVAFLLEHLPRQVHLAMASRSDPPLPLARLRARGDLREIRAADLRFTVDEATAYFRESMALDLADADVKALEARTEGWIAALQLAALSLQGRDDVATFIANFTGDDRFVVDYLAEEVLERQADDVREFLLQTSILSHLTAPLCDAVTAGTSSKAMLEALERANLFVVPLDDHRVWYRYHHLFGDVLRARLLGERPAEVEELHRRASAWYEASGDQTRAVGHALAGADFERAARLIELAATEMRRARQESTLRRWIETLPESLLRDRPVLSATLAGARMGTGDPTGVASLLDTVETWLGPGSDAAARPIVFDLDQFASLPAEVAMYRAGLALLAGDTAGAVASANQVLELAQPSDHYRRGAAAALIGLARWAVGDLESAGTLYAKSRASFVAADFIPDVLGVSLGLADIQLEQGRLKDARRTFDAGLKYAADRPGLRGSADMHVGLCEIALELNDLEAAARHLHASREHGDAAGLPQNAYRWRVARARLLDADGDVDGAIELLGQAERFYNTDYSPAFRPVSAVKARVALRHGDVEAARRWASTVGITADDDLTYVREFEHVTLARVLLAETVPLNGHAAPDTIAFLHRLLVAAEGYGSGRAIEILVLLACAHQARGDATRAAETLAEALARAHDEGYVRVFVEEGPAMVTLLQGVAFTGAAAAHARRVLAAGETRPPAQRTLRPSTALVDDLSDRELDVVRLLGTELSGPDIARELVVSLNTLRTHTKNIYAKLGVNNRREAIRRAAELGI